jgi:hypothetical protein
MYAATGWISLYNNPIKFSPRDNFGGEIGTVCDLYGERAPQFSGTVTGTVTFYGQLPSADVFRTNRRTN